VSGLFTRSFSVRALALALTALPVLGCSKKPAESPASAAGSAASAPEDDDAMAAISEHHRFHHHGGVTLFIAMSLDTLGVSSDKRAAVEAIRTELHAQMQPALAAEQALVTALADGLSASRLDPVQIDAQVERVVSAASELRDATADGLNRLHALLSPAERAALVDKVDAHFSVWQKSNADEGNSVSPPNGSLTAQAHELGLTAEQEAKIRASLQGEMKPTRRLDEPQIRKQLQAFGEAFRKESFDAKAFNVASAETGPDGQLAGWGATYLAHFVEAANPVLAPEQRIALARRLHEHAAHNPSAEVSP
jgi:Spy/CpxP family protein refolding chaperone